MENTKKSNTSHIRNNKSEEKRGKTREGGVSGKLKFGKSQKIFLILLQVTEL